MLTLAILAAIWIISAVAFHIHRRQWYEKRPHLKSRQGEGLVAFSERQYWWLMTLWPLAVVAAVLYVILLAICAFLEVIKDWWEARHVPK